MMAFKSNSNHILSTSAHRTPTLTRSQTLLNLYTLEEGICLFNSSLDNEGTFIVTGPAISVNVCRTPPGSPAGVLILDVQIFLCLFTTQGSSDSCKWKETKISREDYFSSCVCVLVFLGAELIFFIVAMKGLYFGFLLEAVLITKRIF